MPVQTGTIDNMPSMVRGRRSMVTQRADYMDIRTKMADGLKRGEAVWTEFKPSAEKGEKSILQTMKRTLQADLKRLRLNYTVRAYKSDNGNNVVAVINEEQPVAPSSEGRKSLRTQHR